MPRKFRSLLIPVDLAPASDRVVGRVALLPTMFLRVSRSRTEKALRHAIRYSIFECRLTLQLTCERVKQNASEATFHRSLDRFSDR